jgi:hypothetical protein
MENKRKNPGIIITPILLVIMSGNCLRILSNGNIRTVEFIAILATGVLLGILIMQLITLRNK